MSDYAAKALKWVVLRTQVSVNCYNEAVSRCIQALKRFEGPDLHAPSDSNLAKRADNEQDPGLLIVSLLCVLAINRVLRENNRVRKLQIRAGHIAAEFLNWSDTNLHDRDWDLQLMLGEESRKAWVEANFGKGCGCSWCWVDRSSASERALVLRSAFLKRHPNACERPAACDRMLLRQMLEDLGRRTKCVSLCTRAAT